MIEQRKRSRESQSAFWDTSAIVPLCFSEGASPAAQELVGTHRKLVVWWVTSIEAFSAAQRLIRQRHLSTEDSYGFLARLQYLRSRWNEVVPSEEVRFAAERLLRLHPLKAADALQLAAAIVWADNRPHGHVFVVADGPLSEAALKEGFTVKRI
jgi:predicted nucleic acid-binding protein